MKYRIVRKGESYQIEYRFLFFFWLTAKCESGHSIESVLVPYQFHFKADAEAMIASWEAI